VLVRVQHHRPPHELGRRVALARPVVPPAGEHPRQVRHRVLRVGLDRLAVAAQPQRAVDIQLVEPDREQLHHLARIVLVGLAAGGRIFLLVAGRVQVIAHRRVQGHLFEQRPIASEGLRGQQIPVARELELLVGAGDAVEADDEDLGQGQRHALSQAVGGGQQALPDLRVDADRDRGRVGVEVHLLGDQPVPVAGRRRLRELLVQPALVAQRTHARDLRIARSERGLQQEARGLRIGEGVMREEHQRREFGQRADEEQHVAGRGPEQVDATVGDADVVPRGRVEAVDVRRRREVALVAGEEIGVLPLSPVEQFGRCRHRCRRVACARHLQDAAVGARRGGVEECRRRFAGATPAARQRKGGGSCGPGARRISAIFGLGHARRRIGVLTPIRNVHLPAPRGRPAWDAEPHDLMWRVDLPIPYDVFTSSNARPARR
jgi:hypothetical protein